MGGNSSSGAAVASAVLPYTGISSAITANSSETKRAQETQQKFADAQNALAQMSVESQKELLPYYMELFKNIELPQAYRAAKYETDYSYPLQEAQAKAALAQIGPASDYMTNYYYPSLAAEGEASKQILPYQTAASIAEAKGLAESMPYQTAASIAAAKGQAEITPMQSDYLKNIYYPYLAAQGKASMELLPTETAGAAALMQARTAAIPGIEEYFNAPEGLSEEESNRLFGKARERIGATYGAERQRTGERFASVGGMNSGEYQKAMMDVGYKQAADERAAAIDQAIYESSLLKSDQAAKAAARMNFTQGMSVGQPQAIALPTAGTSSGSSFGSNLNPISTSIGSGAISAAGSSYGALPNIPSYSLIDTMPKEVRAGIESQLTLGQVASLFSSVMSKGKAGGGGGGASATPSSGSPSYSGMNTALPSQSGLGNAAASYYGGY